MVLLPEFLCGCALNAQIRFAIRRAIDVARDYRGVIAPVAIRLPLGLSEFFSNIILAHNRIVTRE